MRLTSGKARLVLLALVACLVALVAVGAAAAPAEAKTTTKKVTLYVDSATQRSKTLKASGLKAKKASWKTSKKKVATVSKKGKATARKKGKATITAKQGKNTYKFKITVKKVSISAKTLSVVAGKTGNVTLVGDKIKAVSSSNTAVATVSKAGVVTGVRAGSATVTLTSKKGKRYTCKVTVAAPPAPAPVTPAEPAKPTKVAVTGVTFAQSEVTLIAPEAFGDEDNPYVIGDGPLANPATVQPSNATNKGVSYESSDSDVATVDEQGTITPISPGVAVITARTADGGREATCTVTVKEQEAWDKYNPVFSTVSDLLDAIRSGEPYSRVFLQTDEAGPFVFAEGVAQAQRVGFQIEAPNATVENSLLFNGVKLGAVSVYKEHRSNQVLVEAENAQITACDGAAPQFWVKAENVTIAVDTSEEVVLRAANDVTVTAGKAITLNVLRGDGDIIVRVPNGVTPTILGEQDKVIVEYVDAT